MMLNIDDYNWGREACLEMLLRNALCAYISICAPECAGRMTSEDALNCGVEIAVVSAGNNVMEV